MQIFFQGKNGLNGEAMAMRFEDTKQYKKGNLGMRLVDEHLIKKGYVPYSPDAINKRHPFDRLVAKDDKTMIFIAEGKTKPARIYYRDTGIDIKNYKEYQHIHEKYNLRVFLFFVDEDKKEIYGNWLDELDKEKFEFNPKDRMIKYPLEQKGIRYFPLSSMKSICKLTKEQVEEIRKFTTRAKKYEKKNT